MVTIKYSCTYCHSRFDLTKHNQNSFTLKVKKALEPQVCPYCGEGPLFNITTEEELGNFDKNDEDQEW